MQVFWDAAGLAHTPQFFLQRGHVRTNFEVPRRAEALLEAAKALGCDITTPPDADEAAIGRVHDAGFLDFLRNAWRDWSAMPDTGPELIANIHPTPEMLAQGAQPGATVVGRLGWYTADTGTPIGEHTWRAARAGAACAMAAADAAAQGRTAYALSRPPGHHAYAARTGGHCILNNAAVAAQRLRDRGASRVAVLDIDSHHGNGTQGIFWDRPDVLFVSVHGDPNGYYPWFVGHASERGGKGAEGANLNLPLARGADDATWLAAIDQGLAAIGAFRPDALVVSLGMDASEHEPLGWMKVTDEGFVRAGAAIGAAGLPTAIVQEGGYNTDLIGTLLTRFLTGING